MAILSIVKTPFEIHGDDDMVIELQSASRSASKTILLCLYSQNPSQNPPHIEYVQISSGYYLTSSKAAEHSTFLPSSQLLC